jgi:hypothetical protein
VAIVANNFSLRGGQVQRPIDEKTIDYFYGLVLEGAIQS